MDVNTHLEHIEDLVYTDVKKLLECIKHQNSNLSLKLDGAPAIIFGINPENNKFFLGTKSVFNKNPKINYSIRDIMVNHSHAPELQEKLIHVFAFLESEKQNMKGVYQCDLMYTNKEYTIETARENNGWDDTLETVSFQANILEYSTKELESVSKVKDSFIGIAIHTFYKGLTMDTLSATFEFEQPVFGTDIMVMPVDIELCSEIQQSFDYITTYISEFIDTLDDTIYNQFATSMLPYYLKIYENHLLRTESCDIGYLKPNNIAAFSNWLIDKKYSEMKKFKTISKKLSLNNELVELITMLHEPKMLELLSLIGVLRRNIVGRKDYILRLVNNRNAFSAIADNKRGHEGVVFSNTVGRMKIVDRPVFSRINFQQGRFQK